MASGFDFRLSCVVILDKFIKSIALTLCLLVYFFFFYYSAEFILKSLSKFLSSKSHWSKILCVTYQIYSYWLSMCQAAQLFCFHCGETNYLSHCVWLGHNLNVILIGLASLVFWRIFWHSLIIGFLLQSKVMQKKEIIFPQQWSLIWYKTPSQDDSVIFHTCPVVTM